MQGTKAEIAEARARQDREAREKLEAAMKRPPFDIQTAGSNRVNAWKVAMADAQKLLNQRGAHAADYDKARSAIQWCANGEVQALARYFLKDHETGKRAKTA